ncbi:MULTISPECIES: DeoR/GlpR family DNA-binding transcription regulator [unclassified Sporolactobacillus]|uniref:DeoR/GlpR family DNA-binding transcription regulator n=1 Tax=unclassified Sporolactobacillus TaxID=2628533 RepID=UPI002368F0F6|nr:DeoR/GlpR family DNA-binding transcription regulator [Sporolactobacillus sp. CQH2019]MDD9150235.1 DeoR/GlpR family DNA-binding transcription regulator [Sporolactobacillus sp. CQH2019]
MKTKRLQEIEDYVVRHETVTLDELCKHFDVSKNTIRRDINTILKKGTIKKVYGGVTIADPGLIPFSDRDTSNQNEKIAISRCAAQFIEENDIVFIDSGTTTRHIVEFIPSTRNATIVTNNLDVINSASQLPNLRIIVVGNVYKRDTNSFIGLDGWDVLEKFNIDKAFMATTGLSISRGLTNTDILEYSIKKEIVKKSHVLYVLADHSKFDKYTLLTYAELDRVDALITGAPLKNEYAIYCKEHDINVYQALAEEEAEDK